MTEQIIGEGMRVHTALGPGLLESAYEACLAYELTKTGYFLEWQKRLPIVYGELRLEEGYRIDLLVEKAVIVELKAVTRLEDVHEAQLLSYLRLSGCEIGLLINFNVKHLRDGLRRVINTKK
jgi:GxxExxY protein